MAKNQTPVPQSLEKRLAELSSDKRALVERLLKKDPGASPVPVLQRRPAASAPMSYAQQRLWMLDQLTPGSPFYTETNTLRLKYPVDPQVLERSVNEIVRRHESLRTTFQIKDEQPIQVIAPSLKIPVRQVDLRWLPEGERDTQAVQVAARGAQELIDISRGPLLRVTLIRLAEDDHVLILDMHHIICDGWSMGIFAWELFALYKSFSAGLPSPLPDLPIQYADFAVWQRDWLKGKMLQDQLDYWKHQLADLPRLELPTDYPRPAVPTYRGAAHFFLISERLIAELKALSQREGVSLFMTLLAAFQCLLSRYTGQEDIVLGVPISNRNRTEITGLIGFFVNTLVMRTDLSGDPSFRDLLGRVKQMALGAYAHQDVPFEKLVEELQPERDMSRNPLFQVVFQVFNLLSAGDTSAGDANEDDMVPFRQVDTGAAKFDLRLDLIENPHGLNGFIEYSTDLYNAASIERMAGHFQTLLSAAVSNTSQRISTLPLLTEPERLQLLVDWNQTSRDYPHSGCAHELVAAQARRTPNAVAIVCEGRKLTYKQVDERAESVAGLLRNAGVGRGDLVGVCMQRSPEMIVGLLGVLKAGGAYVPLDPAYPSERLAYMMRDSGAEVQLTQRHLAGRVSGIGGRQLCVGEEVEGKEGEGRASRGDEEEGGSREGSSRETRGEEVAYVIYTSGSTGTPKGVMVEHRSLMNLVRWHQDVYSITAEDRATHLASPAFDASVWEIWPYLTAGASLYIPSSRTLASPTELAIWLAEQEITICFLPTPLAESMLEHPLPSHLRLRTLLTGGDKLHHWPAKELPFRLINHYGPTENTVVSTCAPVEGFAEDDTAPPIGRPIANTAVYVLDRHGNLVPVGIAGELYVSGDGLARGYYNHPDLTAERFLPHPFQTGARLYRTGDRVRYRPDGSLDFLGRIDRQVKLRGYRIELGEVESVLRQHPVVQDSVVLEREDTLDNKQLVAYVVLRAPEAAGPQPKIEDIQVEQISEWQTIFDETVGQEPEPDDPMFNIIGWNSSYTGLPIPAEEMQEQVERTVERILDLNPKSVLEIGCGTGLLLLRIAPQCESYVGTDFSRVSLDYVQKQVNALGLDCVQLRQQTADEFEGLPEGAFDMVVLNSVVQYFPSIQYLLRVLSGCVKAVKEGGYIFIGDVRNFSLHEPFCVGVELHRASPSLSTKELRTRVQRLMQQEQELLVDPAFFRLLRHHFPEVRQVAVGPKRGLARNELTSFRYDVVLQVGGELEEPDNLRSLSWREVADLTSLRQLLQESQPQTLGITAVPSARSYVELKTLELLASPDCPATVKELRDGLARFEGEGVDPESLWALGDDLPYEAHLFWSASGAEGEYDLLLRRRSPAKKTALTCWPDKEVARHRPWSAYANNPLERDIGQRLTPAFRRFLLEKLPDYMVPSSFVVLEAFPLTPNGKIDLGALPKPSTNRPELDGAFVVPRTEMERLIAEVWKQVLNLETVGVYDNFFELGGHSLLIIRLHHKMREVLNIGHSVIDLFRYPTISSLANFLSGGEGDRGVAEAQAESKYLIGMRSRFAN